MKLRLISILRIWKNNIYILLIGLLFFIPSFTASKGYARIYIDISAPSIQKINIAVPDFKNFSGEQENPDLAVKMPEVINNDLDLSGYFTPMEKGAFLDQDGPGLTSDNIRFQNWVIIGAELLLKGGYTCIGRNVEVEIRLYDLFWGRQILGKKFLGKVEEYRYLMHRVGNEIIMALTGQQGVFLTSIVFVGSSNAHKEIYISDFDGYNVKEITSDRSIALLPAWSPQGDRIAYNSYKEDESMLYLWDLSKRKGRKISGRSGLNTGACWFKDGERIAVTLSYEGNPDIYSIDLNGKVLDKLVSHWGIDVSPEISPDGRMLAFVSNRSGSPQIYKKDLSLDTEERLTFEGKYNTSPAWSITDKIAFSQMDGGQIDIFTVDSDGSNLKRLTENQGNNEDPCWSPDGRYIVFSSNRTGRYQLYLMNANGQNQRRITFMEGDQTAPNWSPY